MKNLSLYIHIPFCKAKCNYCNFVSFTDLSKTESYVSALIKEISITKKEDYLINTIFIGGGTPSCLQAGNISKILQAIKKTYTILPEAEITIEANPNSLTEEKLIEYKNLGINRISIGAQSTNNKMLKSIGRIHNFKDIDNAINLAQKVGFKNINVDILLGLPNQKIHDIKSEIKYLLKKQISHVSAYSLIVEEGTKTFYELKNKKIKLPKEEKVVKMYDTVRNLLKKGNIERYEVSNFAKSGFECRHNLVYWNMGEYLGLGVAAHSFIDNIRYSNTENFEEYMLNITKGKSPIKQSELSTVTDLKNETIMLGLRTIYGFNIVDFNKNFNCNILKDRKTELNFLLKNNLIKLEKENLVVNQDSFYILNSIIQKLIY